MIIGKRILIACLILFCCARAGKAQRPKPNNSDRCTVIVMDLTGKSIDEIRSAVEVNLGSFDTVISEGELTERTFRLPKTKLFVTARVSYDDETMASEKGPDSMFLELYVSAKPKPSILRSLVYAHAELPAGDFDVARVVTLARAAGRKQMLVMECRKHIR